MFGFFSGNKDKKIIDKYRNYVSMPFGVGLQIDNLSDDDILYIHNTLQNNFDFTNLQHGFTIKPIPQKLLTALTMDLMEIYEANNKSKEILMSLLKQYLQSYLDGGANGLFSVMRPSAQFKFNQYI